LEDKLQNLQEMVIENKECNEKFQIINEQSKDINKLVKDKQEEKANTLDTKPNIQPVYPEIPIIPIVHNISPEPSIAVIQINPT